MKIILLLLGGSIGTLIRYGISLLAVRLYGASFPWGTLFVNIAGCFLVGLCFALGNERNILSPASRLFFMTGFLGALTTFSAFALESINLAGNGFPLPAIINFCFNNFGGLVAVLAGLWIGRLL
ncbi:MAG: fluoride efflux transporter CrcB [Pseudomonadota bacterium]